MNKPLSTNPRAVELRRQSAERRALRLQEKQELATKAYVAKILNKAMSREERAAKQRQAYEKKKGGLKPLTLARRVVEALLAIEHDDMAPEDRLVWSTRLAAADKQLAILRTEAAEKRAQMKAAKKRVADIQWLELAVHAAKAAYEKAHNAHGCDHMTTRQEKVKFDNLKATLKAAKASPEPIMWLWSSASSPDKRWEKLQERHEHTKAVVAKIAKRL